MGDWKKVVVESASNTIAQSTAGNAATVTTNANLTGDITSSGNATSYGNAVPIAKGGTEQTTTAVGDLLAADGVGSWSRLAAGTEDYVLTMAGGVPEWEAPDTGSNNYLDGVSLSGTTITYSISGGTDVTSGSIFGSNAFNSTTIPSGALASLNTVSTSVIDNESILEVDLKITNSPTDNYVLTADTASGGFTWVAPNTSTGTVTTTGTINADEFARFDSDGVLEALTATEVRAALNVEDDADANRTISDAIDSSSSTQSASSAAAKAAYDRSWATVNNVSSTGTYESGTDAGPVLTFDGGSTATIPSAASGASGIVTSGTQTFGGAKTFASNVVITGTLTVDGGTTTVESTTVSVGDKNIELASGATQASHADGGGITLKTTSVLSSSIQWRNGGSLAEWTLYRNGDATPLPIQVCMKEVTSGAPSGTEIDAIEGAMCYNSEDNDMYIYL